MRERLTSSTILPLALVALTTWCGGVAPEAWAQDTSVTIEDLRSPTTPAFTLLGISPTEIERPQTPRAFATHLVEAVSASEGLPSNVAIELAPYWLASTTDLTFEEYYEPTLRDALYQTFSVSLASSKPTNGTRLAFGLRTVPILGDPPIAAAEIRARYFEASVSTLLLGIAGTQSTLGGVRDRIIQVRDRWLQDPSLLTASEVRDLSDERKRELVVAAADSLRERLAAAPRPQNPADLKRRIDSIADTLKSEQSQANQKIAEAIRTSDASRSGFILEVSAGSSWTFPENDFEDADLWRAGVWVTPTYRFKNVDIMSVARYLVEGEDNDEESLIDLGARVRLNAGRFGVSAEVINRFRSEDETLRYAGMLEYEVTDSAFMTASFGRNFDGALAEEDGTLIALFGLNIGFGAKPVVNASTPE